jgi:hypothetical protein
MQDGQLVTAGAEAATVVVVSMEEVSAVAVSTAAEKLCAFTDVASMTRHVNVTLIV